MLKRFFGKSDAKPAAKPETVAGNNVDVNLDEMDAIADSLIASAKTTPQYWRQEIDKQQEIMQNAANRLTSMERKYGKLEVFEKEYRGLSGDEQWTKGPEMERNLNVMKDLKNILVSAIKGLKETISDMPKDIKSTIPGVIRHAETQVAEAEKVVNQKAPTSAPPSPGRGG